MKVCEYSVESVNGRQGLTVTAPEGACCLLCAGVPEERVYAKTMKQELAIVPTSVTTEDGRTAYYYGNLETGVYRCGASMEGYCAVCQVVLYTEEKAAAGLQVDLTPEKLAGNGYEHGYFILCTPEFMDAHLASEKDLWGQEFARLFRTPQFLRPERNYGRHQQTTNEEVAAFIADLDDKNEAMHVFSLGKSPKYGYDIPLVLFTREKVNDLSLEQAA